MKVTKNLENEINYKLLKAQVSQQVLKQWCFSIRKIRKKGGVC